MTNPDTRGSVDKAFDLLRAFESGDAAGVGVSELARRTGLSKSTAHRLLTTLVQNNAVQRADNVYRLGPLFAELTQEDMTKHGQLVSEILTPFLAALFERTRMTVHLGYLVGTDVSYANKLHSVTGVRSPSRIGGPAGPPIRLRTLTSSERYSPRSVMKAWPMISKRFLSV